MEKWKNIPWYEWLYQVSNLWRIKSLNSGRWRNLWEKIMKQRHDVYWYLTVKISVDNKYKLHKVHRLVSIAFLKNNLKKETVNHKNWIRDDNRLENLEWNTRSENQEHKYRVLWYKNNFQTNHPFKWTKWLLKGKKWSLNILSKKVWQYTKDWTLIEIFEWLNDMYRKKWFTTSNTCISCKTWKTYKWFIFKYI
jgi:hypothetical protein